MKIFALQWLNRFFSQKFGGGGLAFGDNFRSPSRTGSDGGGGGDSHRGQSLMGGGDLEKLSTKAKNITHNKIRANFGVLSIK